MGGTDFKWGGRAPLAPPLATALETLLREYSRTAVKLSSIDRAVTKGLGTTALVYIFQILIVDIKDCLGHP